MSGSRQVADAVGGSEEGVDGRGGRGKQGALLVAGFRQSDYYTQVPKNQGLGWSACGRIFCNLFLPFAFAENE